MCLIIAMTKENREKFNLITDEEGFCTGYKVIGNNNRSLYERSNTYNIGVNVANIGMEYSRDFINYGFHLLLNKIHAEDYIGMYIRAFEREDRNNIKTIEVFYREEDVIDFGHDEATRIPSIAVRKLTIKSLDGINFNEDPKAKPRYKWREYT